MGQVFNTHPTHALTTEGVNAGSTDGTQADLVDGAIGEASMFHATFGYYAQGVEAVTAVLPEGWPDRLVRFESTVTRGVVAWCLEPHDLWISKGVAGPTFRRSNIGFLVNYERSGDPQRYTD